MGDKVKVKPGTFIKELQGLSVSYAVSLPTEKAITTMVEFENGAIMQIIETEIEGKKQVGVHFFMEQGNAPVEL